MHYIFNHVDIEIKYHDGSGEDWEGARLMSAQVTPKRYELHKQQCQGGPQWPYGLCAELDSWVKRSGFEICPVHCVLLVCETLNSQCQGNISKCWTRIASNWLALHARETGIKLLQESLDKSACFICSFFLHHSAWMFYICQPTWSNLVVIKVVNFKLVSVLLMDFFCLDMSLGQRKDLSSFRKPNLVHLYTVLADFTLWSLIPLKESDAWQDKKIIYPYTAIFLILQYQARERQGSEMWWWFTSHGFSSWDKKWCLHCLHILCSIPGEFEHIIS